MPMQPLAHAHSRRASRNSCAARRSRPARSTSRGKPPSARRWSAPRAVQLERRVLLVEADSAAVGARSRRARRARDPRRAAGTLLGARRRSAQSRCEPDVMREAVIVSAVRTPTGKFLGALKGFTAPQLGALVVRRSGAPRRHRPGDRRRMHHGQRRRPPGSARTRRARRRSAADCPITSPRSPSTRCAARA